MHYSLPSGQKDVSGRLLGVLPLSPFPRYVIAKLYEYSVDQPLKDMENIASN